MKKARISKTGATAAIAEDASHHKSPSVLLLASQMSQYCFARWRLSSSVMLPAGGLAAGRVGGWVADTARWASTVTSR